jgi:hypothetical protein
MDTVGDLEGYPHDGIVIDALHSYRFSQMHERIDVHPAYLDSYADIFTVRHTGIQVYG